MMQEQAKLVPLGNNVWPELYRLMVRQNFPYVPPEYAEAKPYYATCTLFGVMDGSHLMVAFVFGPKDDGICFLDVVCDAYMQGKWATPEVLRALYKIAFDELGLRCLWAMPHGKKALKACLQAGFVLVTDTEPRHAPTLVLTPWGVPKKFRQNCCE